MNIQVDPTSSNLASASASAMLNWKIRPRAVVGYGVKIFHPSPPNYVTRSPGLEGLLIAFSYFVYYSNSKAKARKGDLIRRCDLHGQK